MSQIKDKKALHYIGFFLLAVGIIWSLVWSGYDGHLNLWPLLGGAVFYGFVWFMAWIFRNNP